MVVTVSHEPHRWHVGLTLVVGGGSGQHFGAQPTMTVDVMGVGGQLRKTQISGQAGGRPVTLVMVAQAAVVMVLGGIVMVLLGHLPRVDGRRLRRGGG